MSIYVTAFNGMGAGEDSGGGALQNLTGIEDSDIMHFANDFLDQSGVLDIADDDFEVTAAGADMEVDIDLGVAYVLNGAWVKASSVTRFWRVESDAVVAVELDASDPSQDRIDLIVLQINDAASADDEASNVASIVNVTGTPAGSPSAPAVPADSLLLAEVLVQANVTTISNGDITDERVESRLRYLGPNTVDSGNIVVGAIDTAHVGDLQITEPKIANDAVPRRVIDWDDGIWWEELGRTTLGANGDTITVSGLTAKKYLKIIYSAIPQASAGTIGGILRFNNDSGNNYADRQSINGAGDTTNTSTSSILFRGATLETPQFAVADVVNIQNQAKLVSFQAIAQDGNAGTAPDRVEGGGKWVNTSNQITRVDVLNNGTGNFGVGSQVIVLGHD